MRSEKELFLYFRLLDGFRYLKLSAVIYEGNDSIPRDRSFHGPQESNSPWKMLFVLTVNDLSNLLSDILLCL